MAWTDHAAALEEGIAGRDDLRTSRGQAFAVRRLAQLSSAVHARFNDVVKLEGLLTAKVGLLLHGLLVVVAIAGILLVSSGGLSVARLVTLFLVTTLFVGQINQLAHQLPDIQAGLGAVIRLRQLLAAARPGALVLHGRVTGAWRHEFRGRTVTFQVTGWSKVKGSARRAVKDQADVLAGVWGGNALGADVVEW